MKITGINPTTGQPLESRVEMTDTEVERRVMAAAQAFHDWKSVGFDQRGNLMKAVARELRSGKNAFAELMAREMGKPVTQGRAEVEKCATTCDFYAEHAEGFLRPELIPTEATR